MYGLWVAAARRKQCPSSGVAVLHIDKHDDLELPEKRRNGVYADDMLGSAELMDFFTEGRGVMRNNNFIYAAVAAGMVDDYVWIYPDFKCGQCSYRPHKINGKCILSLDAEGASYILRNANPGASQPEICTHHAEGEVGELPSSQSASSHATHAMVAKMRDALDSPDAEWHRYKGEGQPWILDLDLDYFVPDEAAPKMAPYRYGGERYFANGGEPAGEARGTNAGRVLHPWHEDRLFWKSFLKLLRTDAKIQNFFKWFNQRILKVALEEGQTQGIDDRTSSFVFELLREPTKRVDPAQLDERIAKVAQLLRRIGTRPCLITICRSNLGGYMAYADTPLIEQRALAMLRSVYGADDLPIQYASSTLPLAAYPEIVRQIEAARASELPKTTTGEKIMAKAKEKGYLQQGGQAAS